jgi:hypothetical protein
MKPTVLILSCGIILGINATFHLRADQLEMQNGDRYVGKILSVAADRVEFQSDVLGKVSLPRAKVANLAFGTNAPAPKVESNVAPVSVPTNLPDVSSLAALTKAGTNLTATAPNLSANSDLARQVREQMLAGSPGAAGKYDELVSGFMSGKLNVNDIRREAKSSADQLRKLKSELGPEVGDSLDAYLEVLDNFLNESADETKPSSSTVRPKTPVR